MKYCPSPALWDDAPFSESLIVFGITSFIGIIGIILSVIAMYQLHKIHKKDGKLPSSLYWTQIIFYILGIIYFISQPIGAFSHCVAGSYAVYGAGTTIIVYGLHKMYLMFSLYKRLLVVFKESIFKISRTYINIFRINTVLLFMLVIWTIIILILYEYNLDSLQLLGLPIGIQLVNIIITSQILAWTFVYRLNKLSELLRNNKSEDESYINTITKYSVLSIVSVTFTTLQPFILIISYTLFGAKSPRIYGEIITLCQCFDIFIDTICMQLSLGINMTKYAFICHYCDYNLRICCNKCHNIDIKNMSIQIQQSSNMSDVPELPPPQLTINSNSSLFTTTDT
mmetsp:Transcript_105434/g.128670  ORF Transcript_105434/g.128670 Transcript_105434/m.128670 type:complete len:340 (-) Transcript_105434:158-1177(-)